MLIMLCIFSTITINSYAQSGKRKTTIKQLVKTQKFVFVAETALPMSGGSIQLISPYEVKLSDSSLSCELPYFGTTFTAPINSGTSPLSFTSSDFDYEVEETGTGNFEISITINDPRDPDEMNFSITDSGRGRLTVTSMNRQAITFNGYIKEIIEN